ncbi:aminotransferase class V-fold PLP-dependent enzyme [candidate division KSB1 bacterium]|nr:aminotransferase class V-fold PLP-dependent enzyme [candidate division KSB1 bacterium]
MNKNYFSDDRRSFLKKMAGGIAATAAFPWLTGEASGREGAANFSHLVDEMKNTGAVYDERFWSFVQKQFPLADDLIYMNNGGLGPSPFPVIDAVYSAMLELEEISETGHHLVEAVNKKAAKFFNCDLDEIAFTRNATEGMNIIARGLALKKGDEVLMSTHEHPGGGIPWLALANDTGIRVRLFEPGMSRDENLKIIQSSISSRTKVLAISHITCTNGLKFPAAEIAEICRSRGIFFVLDGAQVPGMIPVDFKKLGCDFYTSSGHKWMCAPKGTGVLYVRKEMKDYWRPTQIGAYSEKVYILEELKLEVGTSARNVEYGTRNTPEILGIGAALDFMDSIGMEHVAERGRSLATYLKEKLQSINKVQVITPMDPDSSGAIVSFKILDKEKSHGELTSQFKQDYNIRLRPVGEHGLNAIRASLHIYNNFEQVDRLIEAVKAIAA